MTQARAESLVHAAESKGRVVGVRAVVDDDAFAATPWLAPPSRRQPAPRLVGPLPESLELTLGDHVYIAKDRLPPALATITRKDGHHPIVFLHCGPLRHRAGRPSPGVGQTFSRRVIVRPTGFRAVTLRPTHGWSSIACALS